MALFVARPTHAQSIWTDGGNDDKLGTNANWSPVPGADADLQFNGAGDSSLILDQNYEAHSVSFSGGLGYTFTPLTGSNTLAFQNGGSLLNTASSAITIGVPVYLEGGFTFNNSGSQIVVTGAISGSGPVTITGGGTVVLAGASTYTGPTTINSGLLEIGNGTTTGASLLSDITNNALLTFLPAGGETQNYNGVISGTGSVIVNGAGTVSLNNANTYSGTTTVESGTSLTDGIAGALSVNSDLVVNSGANVFINHNEFVSSLRTGSGGGTVNLASGTILSSNGNNYVADFAGYVTGLGGINVLEGNNTYQQSEQGFSGNNDYSGGTEVFYGAEVDLGSNTALGTGTVTFDQGSEFSLSTNVTLANPIVLNGENYIENDDGSYYNLTLTGQITGSAGIEWCTTGTLTLLNSTNSFNGGLDVRSGAVVIGATGAAGNGTIQVDSNANLNIASGVTVSNTLSYDGYQGILSGNGTVGAPFTSNSGVVLAPTKGVNGGPDTLTFSQGLTIDTGTTIQFQLSDATAGAGTGNTLLAVQNGLSLTATPGSITFNILSTNSAGGAANALNFDPTNGYSWTFATSTTAINGYTGDQFSLNTSGFLNATNGGTFSIEDSGSSLYVQFTPVPEPSTWALIGVGLAVAAPLAWRRRRAARA